MYVVLSHKIMLLSLYNIHIILCLLVWLYKSHLTANSLWVPFSIATKLLMSPKIPEDYAYVICHSANENSRFTPIPMNRHVWPVPKNSTVGTCSIKHFFQYEIEIFVVCNFQNCQSASITSFKKIHAFRHLKSSSSALRF